MYLNTVQTHFNSEPIDMDEVISNINYPSAPSQKNTPRTNQIKSGVSYFKIDTITLPKDFVPQNVPD